MYQIDWINSNTVLLGHLNCSISNQFRSQLIRFKSEKFKYKIESEQLF